jgi:hypothetical protein
MDDTNPEWNSRERGTKGLGRRSRNQKKWQLFSKYISVY